MLRTIITVIFVFLFLIVSLPIMLVEKIIARKDPEKADRSSLKIVQWALKVVSALAGVQLTVLGEEKVPTDKAVLYAGNHQSFFDIVVTYARCPRPTGYISKEGVFKVPVLGTWMRMLHCLSINRSNTRDALKTIQAAISQVKNGISMTIYPEGTRNQEPEKGLLPFKEGSFKIAERTGCPIVPMVVIGTEQVFEAHFPWLKKSKVVLEYGDPVNVKELSKDEKRQLGAKLQEKMQGMADEIRRDYF